MSMGPNTENEFISFSKTHLIAVSRHNKLLRGVSGDTRLDFMFKKGERTKSNMVGHYL